MLKPTVKRGLMLDFIPDEIIYPEKIAKERIEQLNNKPILEGKIVYIINREYRVEDNWALLFATQLSKENNKDLLVLIYDDKNSYSKSQEPFFYKGLEGLKSNLNKNNIEFEVGTYIPQNCAAIVIDFNPVNSIFNRIKDVKCAVFEVDSHNIIPAKFVSDKQEFSAATLRRKIYSKTAMFLTEYPNKFKIDNSFSKSKLGEFINNKLGYYAEGKNNPINDVTSQLSPFLHFGFISAQRIALEVLKANAGRANKEAFLEELIVRKELSDNFCHYAKSFTTLDSILPWAKETLNQHKNDIRAYNYSLDEFEFAKTHDKFWNKIQNDLLAKNRIHGYLRMYWCKKILEWSKSPEFALDVAIYLNDKYALDGMDSNGYVGILWSIGGLHDRPFTNRLVTGKIRYMGLSACKRNFDVKAYINED